MKIGKNEKAMAWLAAYAVATHALVSGGETLPKTIDSKAKGIADRMSETMLQKLEELEIES